MSTQTITVPQLRDAIKNSGSQYRVGGNKPELLARLARIQAGQPIQEDFAQIGAKRSPTIEKMPETLDLTTIENNLNQTVAQLKIFAKAINTVLEQRELPHITLTGKKEELVTKIKGGIEMIRKTTADPYWKPQVVAPVKLELPVVEVPKGYQPPRQLLRVKKAGDITTTTFGSDFDFAIFAWTNSEMRMVDLDKPFYLREDGQLRSESNFDVERALITVSPMPNAWAMGPCSMIQAIEQVGKIKDMFPDDVSVKMMSMSMLEFGQTKLVIFLLDINQE